MSGLTKRKIGSAIAEFMSSDKIRKKEASTRYNYGRCLKALKDATGYTLNTTELRATHINITLGRLSRCACGAVEGGKRCAACNTRGRTEISLNNDRSILKTFVRWLHDHNMLSRNQQPCADVEMHSVKGYSKPIHDMILTPDQARDCLIEAGNRHPSHRVAFAVGLFAAMRESEVLELRWRDIRIEGDGPGSEPIIRFYREKQNSWHTIPLAPALRQELDMWRLWMQNQFGRVDDAWYVVPRMARSAGGTQIGVKGNHLRKIIPDLKRGRLDETYHAIFKAVGCDREGFGSHTLRRTGACFLLAHCKDKDLVRQYLGHSSVKTTETYTQHLDRLPELMEAVRGYDPVGVTAGVTPLPRVQDTRSGDMSNVVAFRTRKVG